MFNTWGSTTSNDVGIEVRPAQPTVTWPTASVLTLGESLNDVTLQGGSASIGEESVNGVFVFASTQTPPAGTAEYAIYFIPDEDQYFQTVLGYVEVTVNETNTPPTISSIPHQYVALGSGSVGPLSFEVGDAETPVDNLHVSATSTNADLLPDANLVLGGSGANRSITLTPLSGVIGSAEITLTVRDSSGATSATVFMLTVTPVRDDATETYLMIDISAGPDAEFYPVTETDQPVTAVNSEAFKTDRIILRRIPAGTFTIGSPSDELGRADNEDQRQVTLTQDYYIGVFQVTQGQWQQVMGNNPSAYTGSTRPVEQATWNDVRGGIWDGPSGGVADTQSFIGRLAARTGMDFDLPTEAQWEYAARAETTTALNNGENLTDAIDCPVLSQLGRYQANREGSQHAPVGSYQANAWGLYDMHGNVWEWCRDWYQENLGTDPVSDPVGPTSGTWRVLRGGDWSGNARYSRSASRINHAPDDAQFVDGFRLASSGSVLNTAPTITSIADQFSVADGSTIGPIAFTIGDAETPAGDLTVTGSSSNTTLVPNGNITLGGSDAERTVTITPASGETGTATITLTVEDAGGLTASSSFIVTVGGENTPPTISSIADQTTPSGTP
ncbi:MAG: formylglycine-generating enzyme family protein, partial [Planctomycetota bacterium]